MGSLWLPDLPDWLEDAGLEVRCWDGWETRSRSLGRLRPAVGRHRPPHRLQHVTRQRLLLHVGLDVGDQPIGAILLERSGRVTIGAAGATNCAGKGGPLATSHGTIPADKGNAYAFNIEAANNGTGETWPADQQDAYTILVASPLRPPRPRRRPRRRRPLRMGTRPQDRPRRPRPLRHRRRQRGTWTPSAPTASSAPPPHRPRRTK